MAGLLKFGLIGINDEMSSYPETMVRMAQAAEAAGFDSVWASEHVVFSEAQSVFPPTYRRLDPLVALAYIAAHTQTIRLGTGVLIFPQHNPLFLAKELASLDVLSGGRVIFGLGVGWSQHEFEALGVSFRDRGARTDEYLAAIQILWSEARPSYQGRFVSFAHVQAYPHPQQQPYPPIVIGGHSAAALRRAVEKANGWFGARLDLDETARVLAELRAIAKGGTRPEHLGPLEISVDARMPIDRTTAQQFADLGVHRLILFPSAEMDPATVEQLIVTTGKTLVGQVFTSETKERR
jgi:probable F420-dependent oxidoreductase